VQKNFFNNWSLETRYTQVKELLDTLPQIKKKNSKWNKALNIRAKPVMKL
jgi:hypothetical protein